MRVRIEISGVVQGVGFRPAVYRYALKNCITGFVFNSSRGVSIEAQGQRKNIHSFVIQLSEQPPAASVIDSFITEKLIDVKDEKSFNIYSSPNREGEKTAEISPDLATCRDCIDDIFDINNNRFNYPFTNCTNCGPRFTIIYDRPYDRHYTSMDKFTMCRECDDEYTNPGDRRFHAQPNGCARCGPELELIFKDKSVHSSGYLLTKAVKLLTEGKVAAIKGLGGFHFACDPFNRSTVQRLRTIKNRPDKAFALMMSSVNDINKYCFVSEFEKEALLSAAAPIVLLRKKNKNLDFLSPDNNYLGVMLPFSPLHHLILREIPVLIMTSANLRDEPLAYKNSEVTAFLENNTIDFALIHNREIIHRCDDSIVQFFGDIRQFIRRSRGYVPQAITITGEAKPPSLSLGGNKKNTFALTRGKKIFLSQHIGDLTDFRNYSYQKEQISEFSRLHNIQVKQIRCDAHPDYENYKDDALHIFHHHAHMLSVMAEHKLQGVLCGRPYM